MDRFQAKFTMANWMGQYKKRHEENGKFMFLRAIKAITQELSMKDWRFSNIGLLSASIIILTACSVGNPEKKLNLNPTDRHTTSQQSATDALQPSANDALAGTTWRLVQIMSMHDRVDVPDDRSLYTLEFNADGFLRVRADCNFGKGSWVRSYIIRDGRLFLATFADGSIIEFEPMLGK